MLEAIAQPVITWRDRLMGRDDIWNKRASNHATRLYLGLPTPIKALALGVMFRLDSDHPEIRETFLESMVYAAKENGEAYPWVRRAFLLYMDEPSRRVMNHRIDHGLMEFQEKGGK